MDDNSKPTEEEKVIECWDAFKTKGLAGLKEIAHKRNEEYLKSLEGLIQPDGSE